MHNTSSITAQFKRRQLHRQSKLAASSALRIAAAMASETTKSFLKRKARRLEICAITQHERIVTPSNDASFLYATNKRTCQIRGLCMGCEARRAKQQARDLIDLFDVIHHELGRSRALMLTLTSRNRALADLAAMLRHHRRALNSLFRHPRIVQATLGQFGNIEIDFSERDQQVFVHVHSHHILVVEPAALSDHRYIRQAEYVALWRKALAVDYKPIVDIRAIRSRSGDPSSPAALRDAVREVCKYCLDTKGFIAHANGQLFVRPEVAATFALATHRVRFTSMDRIFLQARKRRRAFAASGFTPHQDPDDVPPGPSPA